MQYKFKCNNCGKKEIIDMSMSDYTPEGHFCSECNSELERDIDDFGVNSQWKCKGAYGVGNHV